MTAETGTLARNIGSTFKKVSGWYIAFGVVGALGGIAAIARPLTAGLALTLVIGWILILNGVMAVVSAFAARSAGGLIAQLLLAGAYVLGGVYVLSNPVQGLTALAFVLGLTLFLGGGFKLMLAAALSGVPGIGALILSGVAKRLRLLCEKRTHALWICFSWVRHFTYFALARARPSAGKRIPINNAIIAMTTNNSMRVNPERRFIVASSNKWNE